MIVSFRLGDRSKVFGQGVQTKEHNVTDWRKRLKKFRVGIRNYSTESPISSNCGQLCQPKKIYGGIKNQAQIRALLKNKQTNKKKTKKSGNTTYSQAAKNRTFEWPQMKVYR